MRELEYSAGAVSKGFWFVEFKKYIEEFLRGKSHQELRKKQLEENFLMAPSNDYGRRMVGELKKRISALPDELVEIYPSLSLDNQKLLNFVSILMTDRLLFELVFDVYREGLVLGMVEFDDSQMRAFFNRKAEQSDKVANFTEPGKKRLMAAYKTYMREANLLSNQDNKSHYNRVILDLHLEDALKRTGMTFYLQALTGGEA